MDVRLDGRVALVTGGSRGIGRAIATACVEAGAAVMLAARKEESLREAAAAMPGEVEVFPVNAGDVDGAEACVAATVERFGGLDVLVNNAGTNPHYGPITELTPAAFDKTVQVNVRGPLFWSVAAWRRAFRERPGVILNLSSIAAEQVAAGMGIYGITKAALGRLTRQLAHELAPTRVLAIAPGFVPTDFNRMLLDDETAARAAARLPLGRLGTVEDVARLAVFLASDQASWITGETYHLDGGVRSVPGTTLT